MSSIESSFDPASLDDDLEAELAPLRRRRRLPFLTAFLALAVVAGGAFLGGVEIQKHYGGTGAASPRAAASSSATASGRLARAGRGGFGGSGRGGSASGVVAGQVTLIKGSTLYVAGTGGNTVEVTTSGASVSKTVTSSVKGIEPGDTVVVRGTKEKNGSYRASSISLGGGSPFGGVGGFGSGFGGGGGSAGGGGFGSGFGGGGSNGNG